MKDSFAGHQLYDWFCGEMSAMSHDVWHNADPNEFLASLPDGKQCLFYVGSFVSVFDNGGVREYLCGPHGDDIERAIFFFSKIGEKSLSEALQNLLSHLPEGFFDMDRPGREDGLRLVSEDSGIEDLNQLIPIEIGGDTLERVSNFHGGAKPEGG